MGWKRKVPVIFSFSFFILSFIVELYAQKPQSVQVAHFGEHFQVFDNSLHFNINVNGLSLRSPATVSTYVSPIIANEFPLNAVGAHWLVETPEGSALAIYLRASEGGQNWGGWLLIPPDEEPVAALTEDGQPNPFAGDIAGALAFVNPKSRFVQYRLDFAGSGGLSPVVKRMSLQIIDSADGPEIDDILQTKADRGERVHNISGRVPKPVLVTRAEWGAQAPRYAYTYTMVGHIAFHHTAGVSDYNVTTKDDCAARIRAIQSYHRNTLGWNDVGYAYAICKFGHIFQGREDDNDSNDVRGAHDAFNTGSMGVANLGYFHPPYNQQPTPQMLNALYRLLAWKCDERSIDPQGRSLYAAFGSVVDHIYGHREVRSTACPGDALFPLKQTIKDSVVKIIAGVTTGVADHFPGLPDEYRIMRTFPNPFSPGSETGNIATIHINLERAQPVKLEVYNMLGQVVRVLYDGYAPAHSIVKKWDGKDAKSRFVSEGVYFYRLVAAERVELSKVLVLTR
ncbi:MAG: N-acetylmuramoyl-L-alanine amidase [bacterium]